MLDRMLARLALAAAFLASTAQAVPLPRLLSQEGRLLRADGQPERGTVELTFALYETATGGSAAWSETQSVQLSADGYYAAQLGKNVALPVFDGRHYWLGIAVQGELEMAPRTRLVAAPYALVAEVANRLAGAGGGGTTVADSATDLAVGQCKITQHNFGTLAVFYQVFMTDPGTPGQYVPMTYSAKDGLTNLALGRPASASGSYPGYTPSAVNNGFDNCGTEGAMYVCNGCRLGWWQVDLGSVTMISKVRVLSAPGAGLGCSGAFTNHDVTVATDATASNFSPSISNGSCSVNGSCGSYYDHVFPPVAARWVRITMNSGERTDHNAFYEVQVYGATYPVTLPDANSIRICNYTGATRNFQWVVGR